MKKNDMLLVMFLITNYNVKGSERGSMFLDEEDIQGMLDQRAYDRMCENSLASNIDRVEYGWEGDSDGDM